MSRGERWRLVCPDERPPHPPPQPTPLFLAVFFTASASKKRGPKAEPQHTTGRAKHKEHESSSKTKCSSYSRSQSCCHTDIMFAVSFMIMIVINPVCNKKPLQLLMVIDCTSAVSWQFDRGEPRSSPARPTPAEPAGGTDGRKMNPMLILLSAEKEQRKKKTRMLRSLPV